MFEVFYYLFLGSLLPIGMKAGQASVSYKYWGIAWNKSILVLFLITVLLRGLAYDTGQDYIFYYDYYQNTANHVLDTWGEHTELGYKFLIDCLIFFSSSPYLFFIVSSTIVIGTMIKVCQHYGQAGGWIMLFWWFFMHVLSFNLYRQYYAISFILLGYLALTQKQYIKASISSVLAVLFHTSSILPILIIIIISRSSQLKYNKWLPIGAVIITTVLNRVIVTQITQICDIVSVYYQLITGQIYESDNLLDTLYDTSVLLYPTMIAYIVWIWYGYQFCEKNPKYIGLFNIFVLSLVLAPITKQEILMRLQLYFTAFCPIFLGILMSTKLKKNPIFVCSIVYQFLYYIYTLFSLCREFPLQYNF